jgi:hypothetical protein
LWVKFVRNYPAGVGRTEGPRPIRVFRIYVSMERAVTDHKFKIGQAVNYSSGPFGRGRASDLYLITQLLPSEGGDFQYRIKSADEVHERVAKESQLDHV